MRSIIHAGSAAGTIKGDDADQDAGIKLVLKAIEAPFIGGGNIGGMGGMM